MAEIIPAILEKDFTEIKNKLSSFSAKRIGMKNSIPCCFGFSVALVKTF